MTLPKPRQRVEASTAELWREEAATLPALLDARQITPTQLLEIYLARCDRLDPKLNAFTLIDRDGAAQAAKAATERQKAGRRLGPLDGIPVAIKDNLYVGGMPARWGSLMLEDFVPRPRRYLRRALRAAVPIIVGKTTTPEFALSGRTESRISGTTRNPWNLDLTPGGSSGGAVAAVAAGLAPLTVGTDAGGSIRLPASYTGLVGLRPSNGRVPRRYGFPPMALDFQAIGLVARTVRDLRLLYGAVAGPDVRDPALAPHDANAPASCAAQARLVHQHWGRGRFRRSRQLPMLRPSSASSRSAISLNPVRRLLISPKSARSGTRSRRWARPAPPHVSARSGRPWRRRRSPSWSRTRPRGAGHEICERPRPAAKLSRRHLGPLGRFRRTGPAGQSSSGVAGRDRAPDRDQTEDP